MEKNTFIETVKLIPVYLLFMGTFASASMDKFRSGGVPDWFVKQFEKTFLNAFPGSLKIQYYFIAAMEAAVVLLLAFSALQLEFLAGHDRATLKLALILALFVFFSLGFGLRIGGDFQGAANLFSYFGVTFLIFMYVERFIGP